MPRYPETSTGGGGGGGTVTQGPGSGDPTSPWEVQLSDGAAVYVGAKTGQLPAALDGGGFLKVHEQGTAQADVTDRDARLLGRAKILDSTGAVIDPATKGQLPAALVGGRLSVDASGVAVPVTDNAGSLTVDTPQLPAALVGGRLDINLGATGLTHLPPVDEQRAATLHVTATAAVNTGSTATLPAVIGAFHYITSIQLIKLYSIVGVAAGAGVIITSTNLPGNPAWTTEQLASPAGTATKVIDYQPTTPLRSAAAATATTFVAPAQLQTIWRWNISYFTAT